MQTLFSFKKNTYFVTSIYIYIYFYIHIHMYTLYPHRQGGTHTMKIQGGRVVDSIHSFLLDVAWRTCRGFPKALLRPRKNWRPLLLDLVSASQFFWNSEPPKDEVSQTLKGYGQSSMITHEINDNIYIYIFKGYRPCRRPPLSDWNPCEELHFQNKLGHQITSDQLWMKLVGSGSEKAKHHRNPSPKCPKTKNDPFASLPQAAERAPLKSCKTKSMAAVGGQKPYRNLAWTKTKLDLVGSGCEKAKHHLNPSPKRPKTRRNRRRKKDQNVASGPTKKKRKK